MEALFNPASSWVLVAVAGTICGTIIILASVYREHLSVREKELGLRARAEAASAAQTRMLADRVQVLERIAADKGLDIAAEIALLRDAPRSGRQEARP